MLLRRWFCLLLALSVIFCGLFTVSAYAVKIEQYSYNENVFPQIPEVSDKPYTAIVKGTDGHIYVAYKSTSFAFHETGVSFGNNNAWSVYMLQNGEWTLIDYIVSVDDYIWSNKDVALGYTEEVYLYGSNPRITWVEGPVSYSDFAPVITAFGDQINVPLVIGILAGLAGVSVTLVFMWWGVRKVSGSLMKAFKKGKIRI